MRTQTVIESLLLVAGIIFILTSVVYVIKGLVAQAEVVNALNKAGEVVK